MSPVDAANSLAIPADVLTRLEPIAAMSGQVSAAVEQFYSPVSVAVTGRPAAGRSTLAAALSGYGLVAEELSPPDRCRVADHQVHVLAGSVQPDDVRLVGAGPITVVLGKSDVYPNAEARDHALAAAAALGRPVLAVSALLARAEQQWQDGDLTACQHALKTSAANWDEDLLSRLDRRGIEIVGRAASPDDARAALRKAGGLDPVAAACVPDPRRRVLRLQAELSRLAFGGVWRDEIEQLLGGIHARRWFDGAAA